MRVYGESSSGETIETSAGRVILISLSDGDWALDPSEHFRLVADSNSDSGESLIEIGFPERLINVCASEVDHGDPPTRLMAFEPIGDPNGIAVLSIRRTPGSRNDPNAVFTLLWTPMA